HTPSHPFCLNSPTVPGFGPSMTPSSDPCSVTTIFPISRPPLELGAPRCRRAVLGCSSGGGTTVTSALDAVVHVGDTGLPLEGSGCAPARSARDRGSRRDGALRR